VNEAGPFDVEYAPAAARELRRLPPGDAARTRGPVRALGLEPRPDGAARVRRADYWRIRVGQLRVVYLIDETERRVVIMRVARRSESTYRGLREE
jgi:mRNA interferase RelE/StbE